MMVDTETLTSEQNQFPGWANVPALYYPPPPANYGRRRALSGELGASWQTAHRRSLHDFNINNPPPISELQWAWLQHTLSNSTADWIIVIGNDPVWSVGEHGPTWILTERMLPLMQEAGVALYISGRDPIAQHLVPVPADGSAVVDFVGIGNGAFSNASMADGLPSLLECPYGSLAWVYGLTTGFLLAEVTSPTGTELTQLMVTFYDASGNALYNFTKGNPRGSKGFQVATTNGQRTLSVLGIMFLTAAGLLCSLAGYGYVKSAASRRVAFSVGSARKPGETTPLVKPPTSSKRLQAANINAALASL